MMGASRWDETIAELSADHRCVALQRLAIAFGWLAKRGDGATVPVAAADDDLARDPPRLLPASPSPTLAEPSPCVAATRASSLRSTATSWPGTGTRAGCLKG